MLCYHLRVGEYFIFSQSATLITLLRLSVQVAMLEMSLKAMLEKSFKGMLAVPFMGMLAVPFMAMLEMAFKGDSGLEQADARVSVSH